MIVRQKELYFYFDFWLIDHFYLSISQCYNAGVTAYDNIIESFDRVCREEFRVAGDPRPEIR